VSAGMDNNAPRTTQPPRASHNRARRISKIFIEKEKKSDYWQAVIEEVNTQGVFNQDDINNFIARAVSLEVVSNFKDREAQGGTGTRTFCSVSFCFVSVRFVSVRLFCFVPSYFSLCSATSRRAGCEGQR
jgi:hypothetical protein